jgi:hypothetical protein
MKRGHLPLIGHKKGTLAKMEVKKGDIYLQFYEITLSAFFY